MSPTDKPRNEIPEEVMVAAAALVRACGKHRMLLTGVVAKQNPWGILYISTHATDDAAKLMRAAALLVEGREFESTTDASQIGRGGNTSGNTQLN